ncbi:MAG: nuclear transport factor 2 family protein [Acidobacteria bacterium]|nr:nuclear transport factor 2 family protein [Acidobacteriota bacterium]MCA1609564.1 nuclear transport factor 2 family protein [Acidobacteriota bacterium]
MNSEETKAVLTAFFDALARRDGEAVAAFYAPGARFEDEIFKLEGADVGKMWAALLRGSKTLEVSYTIARAGAGSGTVEWTARYVYPGGGPVVNVILSELELAEGKILRQTDRFDFPRWAAQALGPAGRLLGGFAWFRRAVSRKAAARFGVPPKP